MLNLNELGNSESLIKQSSILFLGRQKSIVNPDPIVLYPIVPTLTGSWDMKRRRSYSPDEVVHKTGIEFSTSSFSE